MINADEHKKLLAQITEIERNSVNYFDVEKEFFLIDSDNLSQVRSKLYGYSIQRNGIYEDDNLTAEAIAGLDGRGCYVYVEVKDGQITIKQDLNGSWGVYLFRHGDYFALSNSFFRLVDHVKFKYPLTINRDYYQSSFACSAFNDTTFTYSEMAVNEIRKLERNAVVHIDIAKKSLKIELIDYKEQSVPLDSEEGLAIVDRWVEFWGDVLRGLAQKTNFIQTDLSGGFDSRISFLLALQSGIDLNKVSIHTKLSNHHTYKEDYEIASKIVEHYGFKLNQPLPSRRFLNNSLSDVFNINFYGIQPENRNWGNFHQLEKNLDKKYILSGFAGETMRGYWFEFLDEPPQKFINFLTLSKPYSYDLFTELFNSKKAILESTFRSICDKYHITEQNHINPMKFLYTETRCVHHFGKFTLRHYFANDIYLSPALDPDIRRIAINTPECPNPRLLLAVIFNRYEPNLLTFPFDSKQSIPPETIEYAKKINERFPRHMITDKVDWGGGVYLQPHDLQAEKILVEGKNNSKIPSNLTSTCLKAMFDSSRTHGLFTLYFDEALYNFASSNKNQKYMLKIIGIAKILEDIEISQRNCSLYDSMKRFLEQDFATIHSNEINIPDKFKAYLTARIDIRLMSTTGDFQILFLSDGKARLSKPNWFQKNGIGYQINSYAGELDFTAKATTDGQIKFWLRGMWAPDPKDKSNLIPYWIDYTKLTVNEETIFDTITPAWCAKPYAYNFEAKAGEEIKIHVEWQPHRSDT